MYLGAYPLLRVLPLTVSLLQRVTFSKRRKGNPKGFAPAYGTSLRLSVPSLRCPSGGIAYGLLRCTSSRWMRLRRTALRAYPRMNTFARPAEGAKDRKPKQDQKQDHKPDQEPLTLALSRRERGLTEVFGRDTPTCNTESNSDSKKQTNRRLTLPERGDWPWCFGEVRRREIPSRTQILKSPKIGSLSLGRGLGWGANPTQNHSRPRCAPHHSTGWALARLQLLICKATSEGWVEGLIRAWERSDRLAQPNTAGVGAAKQTGDAAPGSIP